jgi:hypothetical protein
MDITGRLSRWILASILCCGGCAAPALVDSPDLITPQADAGNDTQRATTTPTPDPPSATELPDAVLIAQAAEKSGISVDQASQFAEFLLSGYGQMGKGGIDQTPTNAAADGIPIPATVSAQESALSPAARATPSGAVSPGRSAKSRYDTSSAKSGNAREVPTPNGPMTVVAPPSRQNAPPRPAAEPATATGPNQAVETSPQLTTSTVQETAVPPTQSPEAATGDAATVAAAVDKSQVSWSKQVKAAMERLRQELQSDTLDDEERTRRQVCMSLLCLAVEDPEQAVEALKKVDERQLEFWRQTVMGMGILLDSDELPKFKHRVETATEHLSQGVTALASLGPLRLSHVTFCTKIDGFGNFVECSAYGLKAGEPVLLYVEVENFTAEQIQPGKTSDAWGRHASRDGQSSTAGSRYVAELHGSFDILDADQRTIVSHTLPVSGDTCRNQRHDFFIAYEVCMPKDIQPGAYTLDLTIEDKKGGKFGNAVVDFRIK